MARARKLKSGVLRWVERDVDSVRCTTCGTIPRRDVMVCAEEGHLVMVTETVVTCYRRPPCPELMGDAS